MTTPRFDFYSLVHKGQRKNLFELTVAAGQLAADDQPGREALARSVEKTLSAIVDHAEAEETFFGPLYREAAPATGERLSAHHADMTAQLGELRGALHLALAGRSAASDLALHRALARFTASYLAHVDAEEASLPELWAGFDDAALAGAQGALVASHPAATVQFNLRNMLPAASPGERVAFLSSLRRTMPPAAFTGVRELVGALVPAGEWARIDAA
jgi:hypothetical protein